MKRTLTFLVLGGALAACGTEEAAPRSGSDAPGTPADTSAPHDAALTLRPQLELVGLSDIYDDLLVTQLRFGAELYLLPDDEGPATAGDAIGLDFSFQDGRAVTALHQGTLSLERAGRYRVLVRVRPGDDGASVTVGGAYDQGHDLERLREKLDEPAPSPDEPAPSPAEPAPSPDEPAPSPDEPAPSPDEPAPSPDEPAPSPDREKTDGFDPGAVRDEGQPVVVSSTRAFDFYAGVVDVEAGATALVVTWDVRNWLRALLAEPLGREVEGPVLAPQANVGFADRPADFRIDAR